MAVCKAWQRALLSLPFDALDLRGRRDQPLLDKQCRWVITTSATFTKVNLLNLHGGCQKLVHAMLHSVNRKVGLLSRHY